MNMRDSIGRFSIPSFYMAVIDFARAFVKDSTILETSTEAILPHASTEVILPHAEGVGPADRCEKSDAAERENNQEVQINWCVDMSTNKISSSTLARKNLLRYLKEGPNIASPKY